MQIQHKDEVIQDFGTDGEIGRVEFEKEGTENGWVGDWACNELEKVCAVVLGVVENGPDGLGEESDEGMDKGLVAEDGEGNVVVDFDHVADGVMGEVFGWDGATIFITIITNEVEEILRRFGTCATCWGPTVAPVVIGNMT